MVAVYHFRQRRDGPEAKLEDFLLAGMPQLFSEAAPQL